MAESNVELARRGFAAALQGDLATLGELLDPEVRWHGGDPDADGACRNRRQALAFMRRFAGRAVTLVDVVAAGDNVVVVMRPESGEEVANLAAFRDGRVVEIVHYSDPDEALAAAAR
jgi:ketosteroid isomerase-like protein